MFSFSLIEKKCICAWMIHTTLQYCTLPFIQANQYTGHDGTDFQACQSHDAGDVTTLLGSCRETIKWIFDQLFNNIRKQKIYIECEMWAGWLSPKPLKIMFLELRNTFYLLKEMPVGTFYTLTLVFNMQGGSYMKHWFFMTHNAIIMCVNVYTI